MNNLYKIEVQLSSNPTELSQRMRVIGVKFTNTEEKQRQFVRFKKAMGRRKLVEARSNQCIKSSSFEAS